MLPVLLIAILFFASAGSPQADEIADRFKRAVELQRQGAWQEAAAEYEALLARAPNYAEAQANLGVVLARLGKYDEARAAYETALRINPALTPILLNLAILYYRAGQFDKAAATLERFIKVAPENTQARQLLGSALVELGRDSEAIMYLEPMLTASQIETTPLYSLGLAYLRLHRPEVAAVTKRLTERADGAALSRLLQGQVYLEAFAFEKAATELEAAGKISAELPRQQFLLGMAYYKLGRTDEARALFEGELKRSPDDFLTLYYLAAVLEQQGEMNTAWQRIEAALKQEPHSVEALVLGGTILLKRGPAANAADAANAVRLLEHARETQPDNTNARYLLARAYQKLGRKEEATREFAEVERLKAQAREREKRPK